MVHHAALLGNQRHHVADVFIRADHKRFDHRLLDFFNKSHFGQKCRIVHFLQRAIRQCHFVNDAGIRRDDVHVVFAAQPFLHNFQVQQAEEAATETEPERDRGFRLIHKRRIVQLQLREVRLEMLVIGRVDRVNPAEHHRMNFQKARQCRRRIPRVRDGVAHFHLLRAFDVRRHVTRLAHFQFLADVRFGIEAADFLDLHIFARMKQLHVLSGP